jgi:hypothetical protein
VQYDSSRDEIGKIHSLSATYDNLEEPLLVNPETLDPSIFDQLVFDKNGQISSSDKRLSKTVSICHLCRPYLNERRKKIWDDLEKEIRYAVLTEQTKEGLAGAFNTILTTFKAKMNDPEKPYIAFRKYILRKDWIKELLKGLGVII